MAKSDKRFVHLHVHSDYSLLDGAAKIQKMVQFAAADNQPGLAITDHGGMPGIIQLFKYAAIAGITPIPGIEVYHVPDVNKMRDKIRTEGKARFHMILLATTSVGYQNLLRLSSEAHLDHFYSKPNVDDAMLAKYSEGVVATSGCLGSRVNQALLAGKYEEAKKFASIHQDIYGRENYFIEVQNHGIEDQLKILPLQVKLSKELGAPLLAANDSHYVDKSEAQMHDALLCLQTAARLTDEDRFRFDGSNNYMRSAAEMYELFPHRDFPNACSNTLLIEEMARGIDVGLPKKVDGKVVQQYLIPEFALPDKKLTAQKHLANLVNTGARKLYAENGKLPQIVVDRIAMELKVIHEMGFDNYFLIVGDIVQWAKAQGIRVGPGRGSAAGSIVAFCTGITGVDPIHYKLYFERFLNPGRKSMPDIDIDFERDRRGEVSQYVALKYPGRTAYIATYGVLRPKTAMLGASRVLGNAVSVGQRLSGMWMGTVNQIDAPLREILGDAPTDEKFTDHWRMGAPLRDTYKKDGVSREAIDLAIQLEGIHNQKGIHPAGLLITPGPLTDYVPLHRAKDGDVPVCSFDKDDSEAIGGLKMDLLGLVNLSMIGRTIELVKLDVGTNIDIDNIPLDDKKVYKMLGEGDSDGVFQLESHGMRDLLRRVKPESIEDISAVIALFRPGPMGSNLHLQFADAKNGKIKIQNPHKDMNTMFADTYGALCVAGNTFVVDATTGLTERIDEIEERVNAGTFYTNGIDARGNQVARRVTHFYRTGIKSVIQITLANNRVLRVSAEHPVLTLDGWKPAGELSLNSRLATPLTERPITSEYSSMTVDQARMIGYILGDGSITTHVNSVTSVDQEVFDELTRIVESSFPDTFIRMTDHKNSSVRHMLFCAGNAGVGKYDRSVSSTIRHESMSMNRWLVGIGYGGGEKSRTKFIPDIAYSSSPDVIRNLLAALWDTDGHVNDGFTFLKTISHDIATGTQKLLDILGIPSRVAASDTYESKEFGATTPYGVYVYDHRFWEEIVPLMVVPHKRNVEYTKQIRVRGKRGISVSSASAILAPRINAQKIIDRTPRRKTYGAGALSTHIMETTEIPSIQIGYERGNLPERMIPIHAAANDSIMELLENSDEIALQLNMDWSRVTSIEMQEPEQMYDITVDEVHNFLAEGIVVHNCYQEQLIALAQHYAGYDASEADSFRKAVGKKDADLIAHQEKSFKAGVLKNGYAQSVADKMWEMIPPFAAYAFNKSHSVAYAFISYQTAWLKVNYPAQYAAACIDFLSSDKVFVQVESARRSGVRVSPPNINSSRARATTSAGHVWLGLGGISNCGPAALTGILTAQEDGEFNTLGDFMVRTSGVNRKTIHSLVSAGCFDSLHGSRKIMHDNIEVMLGRARRAKTVGQAEDVMDGLFGDVMAESGIKDSMDFDLDGEDYTTSQRIANEIIALGFPASEHPFHFVREYLEYAPIGDSFIPRAATPVGEDHLVEGSQVVIFGTASSVVFTDAKGTVKPKTTFFIETDKGGRAKCVAFGFEFATLNAGDLVIADGMLRKYQVAGADQEEFRVTGGKFIDLDRIVAETKLLSASGKKVPKEYAPEGRQMTGRPDENQRTSRRRNSTGSEAASARSASTTGETVTFTLDEQYQVQELVTVLDKLDAGDTKVFIGFGGQVGSSDDGYDLSKKKASKIAEKLGVGVTF